MLPALQLFPAWFPGEELLLGLAVFVIAIILMNRGDRWIINVLAADEPLVVGVGAFVVALSLSGRLVAWTGVGSDMLWAMLGVVVAAIGLFVYRSDRYDISNLI